MTARPNRSPRYTARTFASLWLGVVAALTASCVLPTSAGNKVPETTTVGSSPGAPSQRQLFGAFLGSDEGGVRAISEFEQFLGGADVRVGHTYLPGDDWEGVEGPEGLLAPWAQWSAQHPDDLFVLNVPMATPNEANLGDGQVAALLSQGAAGEFDRHFAVLARRLVDMGLEDAVLILGWEMNGVTYSHRCRPDPDAWKAYYRRIVGVLRAQPGQAFRFDFNPSRGTDAISWAKCYPGDDVVDIIGMDSYDQPPGGSFADYVNQPDGLQAQVDFAAEHGKPVSYPEWGLFRHGDNPDFIRDMHQWMSSHDTVYSTLTDYCPHGVFMCRDNPQSAAAVRQLFGP